CIFLPDVPCSFCGAENSEEDRMKHLIRLFAGLALFGLSATPSVAQSEVKIHQTEAAFSDVIADLEDAVVNRGYVVDYHGYIGEMLKRTANDVGASKPLYRNAEFIQFCSAVVSRDAMEADVANIAFCPYVLFAYETEADPG